MYEIRVQMGGNLSYGRVFLGCIMEFMCHNEDIEEFVKEVDKLDKSCK